MKNIKVTRAQYKLLQTLTRKDMYALQKHPHLVGSAKKLVLACKKTIKKIEDIPQYYSRKKRETAYRRIVAVCRKAIEQAESN